MEIKFNKTFEDIGLKLLKIYSQNKLIYISFYENGFTNNFSGMIENIDFVEKEIVMVPLKKISFLNILNINVIS
jgi:hypothetical protein